MNNGIYAGSIFLSNDKLRTSQMRPVGWCLVTEVCIFQAKTNMDTYTKYFRNLLQIYYVLYENHFILLNDLIFFQSNRCLTYE